MSTATTASRKTARPRRAGKAEVELSPRQRFLDACHCQVVDRPPVWLMRQAGRALPEYRALKEKHTFLELVQTPELAAEVTSQPIRRFDFDAAILFSDILVIAEGLGQRYQFREPGGIKMEFLLESAADIDRLDVGAVNERLNYVFEAITLTKRQLGGRTALIGFAGSPWTLANFMLEGGGVKEHTKAKELYHADPALFGRLMEKLTKAVAGFLERQIEAGVDAVQIFDSLGGELGAGHFAAASGRWIGEIVGSLSGAAPTIVFSKGTHGNWADLAGSGADVIGVDWNVSLRDARNWLPGDVAVQGNLDPFLLTTTPGIVATETKRVLEEMRGRPGHIFNLGHGVPPTARLENISSLVETVKSWRQA